MVKLINSTVKEKIVLAHLSGKGRNQIFKDLTKEGIKVSLGSISNFINAYKKEHQNRQPSPHQQLPTQQPPPLQQQLQLRPSPNPIHISGNNKRLLADIDSGSPLLKAQSDTEILDGIGQAEKELKKYKDRLSRRKDKDVERSMGGLNNGKMVAATMDLEARCSE